MFCRGGMDDGAGPGDRDAGALCLWTGLLRERVLRPGLWRVFDYLFPGAVFAADFFSGQQAQDVEGIFQINFHPAHQRDLLAL